LAAAGVATVAVTPAPVYVGITAAGVD